MKNSKRSTNIPELVVITCPGISPDEIPAIIGMFEEGLQTLHLRKPGMNRAETIRFLDQIPETYHPGIALHQHYDITDDYTLKGIHLPEKARKKKDAGTLIDIYRKKELSVSTSFHATEALLSCKADTFDYAFLSPVFDSISKTGYGGHSFDLSGQELPFPVLALGGVTPEHIPTALQNGFSGIAVLGYIWNASSPVEAFRYLLEQYNKKSELLRSK
ncbi:thiamine-phosphate pyrophosphorylase [Sinomicrobium oceani]|uniref:Thiamine-phosphate pyrophosphorylase n=1 Tax=Sinomicrobium oceani TaxID=1150368 RepID=A0A1K1RVM2_9FLAO|nr:thiamine phosphate synthase [Sinomicrobium oceani]SFW75876.1 thiamine-phosphate pyrophosphorylase [Sinomicrobium oceani]